MIVLPRARPLPPADFRCQACGTCCRQPGVVNITEAEAAAIARFLCLELAVFLETYTRLREDRRGLVLAEDPDGGCVFIGPDNRCRIQECKPEQCRTFPFLWRNPGYERTCQGMQHER